MEFFSTVFNSIYEFFVCNFSLSELISLGVYLVLSLIILFKRGDKKLLWEVLSDMKYRLENYQDEEKASGQTFDKFKPVYRLNKATDTLEKTDEVVNIPELVNSALDSCLNAILDKFLPGEVVDNQLVGEYNGMVDDLDSMTELLNLSDYYKGEYNLPLDYTPQQVFEFVQGEAKKLKDKLYTPISEVKEEIKDKVIKTLKDEVEVKD